MTDRQHHRFLASRLADEARAIAETQGDAAAQVLVYGSVLRRWEADLIGRRLPETPQVETLLDKLDLDAVRRSYVSRGMDPSIYFYEDFLRAYDPRTARKRGVHYSPPEVVEFMVRGVHDLLHSDFGESLTEVAVLDPCCGIGTFLRHIQAETGPPPEMIGMEISQAACRLAEALLPQAQVFNSDWLSHTDIGTHGRVFVIVGNPPYSGHSANPGRIAELVADYRGGLDERNSKWLQDDYVKFIRMAQHRIKEAGRGIVAFITNHCYLFNPTFRAMRRNLMDDFDLIYAVDLQGNARRNDAGVSRDENVFPIQMGVAISFMVRRDGGPDCDVRYSQVRGSRLEKLSRLSTARLRDLSWKTVGGLGPLFAFVPRNTELAEEYLRFPSVLDFFGKQSVGFVTSRDAFAVDSDRQSLLERMAALRDSEDSAGELRARYPIGDLDVPRARAALLDDANWQEKAIPVLYRPFDVRWAYYSREIMERPRLPFMKQMMADNVAIVVGRAGHATGSETWEVAFCADLPVDLNLFRRGGATILPRYLFSNGTRESNILSTSVEHGMLFNYIYAILYSLEYRTRYSDFLRFDYPRIPVPSDGITVQHLADEGNRLMRLHLMRREPAASDAEPSLTIGGYDIPGKFIADRAKAGLSQAGKERVRRIHAIAAETADIQRAIDGIILANPPWSRMG